MMTGTQALPMLGVLRELVAYGIMRADSYVCGFDLDSRSEEIRGAATLN
jgi:hypothetical protein